VLIASKVAKWGKHRGLAPNTIQAAAEDSLRRLGTDHIDLYQAHEDDPNVPMAETLGAFSRLIEQGKVRAIGASNFSAARLAEALAVAKRHRLPRYECLQPEYSLLARREFETELAPLLIREGLGAIGYLPLASGFLTGKYRSESDLGKSVRGDRVREYLDACGLRVLAALDAVAGAHGATPAQIALAWLMARPGLTAPIASATSVEQLRELMVATELTLSAAEIGALERASD
jgi:aryl-alcohol dehydrogenase-like predicted oxidoreductase